MSATTLLDDLTERELELIPLLAEGLSNKEIAERLFLAPSTVKWYVRQVNSKLDTTNREEIIERADELGLMRAQKAEDSYLRPRENMPRQTTPFIGRDSELDEIYGILGNPDVHLLTILAPGGMGKTRIGIEASQQQMNNFRDGVYFVPLQPLSEADQIILQVATSTFFNFQNDSRSQKQQLLDFLHNQQMLLCLDNWEHLLDGVSLVNEISSGCARCQNTGDLARKAQSTRRDGLCLAGDGISILGDTGRCPALRCRATAGTGSKTGELGLAGD